MAISPSSSFSHVPTRELDGTMNSIAISAMVVGPDGRLEEFQRLTTAAEVISGHPDCYMCSSDTMVINSAAPQLPEEHVLHFGQIYFLMPLSKLHTPLSLQDLCALAIKASTTIIGDHDDDDDNHNPVPVLDERTRLSCRDMIYFKGCKSGHIPVHGSSSRVIERISSCNFAPCRKLPHFNKRKF
ncbi:hypothetical protein OROHE_026979 [Orobanche hederae]